MASSGERAFEIQTYSSGRWQVRARMGHDARQSAIREAKDLSYENPGLAVRVIFDEYSEKTQRHKEVLVYRNGVKTEKPKKGRVRSSTNWADMAVDDTGRVGFLADDVEAFLNSDDDEDKPRYKAKTSTALFMGIIFMIFMIAAGSGGIAIAMLSILIRGFDLHLPLELRQNMNYGLFLLVFMIAATSAFNYYRVRFDLNPFSQPKKIPQKPKKRNKDQAAIAADMEKAAQAIDKMASNAPQMGQTPDDFAFVEETEALNQEKEGEETSPVSLSETAEKDKIFLHTFIATTMQALRTQDGGRDQINRFGLNLFLTGAAARIATDSELKDYEFSIIARSLLQALGAKPEQSERFIVEFQKYLVEQRHRTLFKAGGEIAARINAGDQSAVLKIVEVLDQWTQWRNEDHMANPNLRIIMFTDLVGSTDFTSKHGDFAAQEVLKSHDLIVRSALMNFEGKEIKHTGDGIMASFRKADRALKAAIHIMKKVDGNNNADPEFPFSVRVGMNAGEPIRKDNDLFGSSVQLAARLCDRASSDSIYISEALKDHLDDNAPFTFVDLGQQSLKGFTDLQQLYEVDWKASPVLHNDMETVPEKPMAAPDDPDFSQGLPNSEAGAADAESAPAPQPDHKE